MSHGWIKWSREEVELLEELWPNASIEKIKASLSRTWHAIERKASYLGIKRNTRKYEQWSLDNFDNGYIYGDRYFVYYPDHSRTNKYGYVLRAIVAYETYHGIIVSRNGKMDVHHKDGNTLNDSKKNLELILTSEHGRYHALKYWRSDK